VPRPQLLAPEIAVTVDDALGLTTRARCECHQRRLVRLYGGSRRRTQAIREFVDPRHRAGDAGRLHLRLVARVRHNGRDVHHTEALPQVLRAQLFVAGAHDVALSERCKHREHPLGTVADQRHDDVPALQAQFVQHRREVVDPGANLWERPLATGSVPRPLDQCRHAGRPVENVRREVHDALAACSKRQRTTGGSTNGDGPGQLRSS
jgi:hypothetical protein